MPSISTSREREGAVLSDFVDLLCADEELLRSEFEEIIAASWDDPPPPPATEPHRSEPRSGGAEATHGAAPRTQGAVTTYRDDHRSRQRSPPLLRLPPHRGNVSRR
jgi:hypothetical protein